MKKNILLQAPEESDRFLGRCKCKSPARCKCGRNRSIDPLSRIRRKLRSLDMDLASYAKS